MVHRGSAGFEEMDEIKPHHLANAIRRSLAQFKGKIGPKFAQVNLDLLFVRNEEFFRDLAEDMEIEWWLRLIKDEAKPTDPELISIMQEILWHYSRLRKLHTYRSEPLARMVKGETLRKVMRNSPGRVSISVMEDLDFCLDYLVKNVGKSSLYRLI